MQTTEDITANRLIDDNVTGRNHSGFHANNPVKFLTATSILGDHVSNVAGDHLGKIKDLMMDLSTGKIEYVVVEFGGFLDLHHKYFAIPFNALQLDAERSLFILNQTLDSFENQPGFNKDHWPNTNFHTQFTRYQGSFMGANTGSEF